jgi:hypothetical protein
MKIQDKDHRLGHFRVSLIKSGVRFVAGLCLCLSGSTLLNIAGLAFIIAEILGIVEEVV